MINWYRLAKSEDHIDDELIKDLDEPIWESVQSSFIDSAAYHKLSNVLEVKFSNGNIYTFMNIPQNVYDDFMKSDSKGKFFNSILRNYKHQS